ncbi:MAG: hypothetical protein HOQ22_18155 [Nocardioidaceae bacterium]|nr:hypothetical protein [Nocardioidaceae bacterium]NUS52950.1 hypothetical protein [Nocardioidaceae bacterium]
MSGSSGTTTADRQRMRSARGTGRTGNRMPAPPRQRRPALAAIAVLLIVGGALVAGLLAIRMDSRVQVIAVSHTIEPGHRITAGDLVSRQIATDERMSLIGWQYRDQVIGKFFARATIYQGMLLDQKTLTRQNPVEAGRAIVSVQLNPALTPKELAKGDLVQVVRASDGSTTRDDAKDLTQGLVMSVTRPEKDSLGGASSGSVSLLVPEAAAKDVIDASHAQVAGLALLKRGQTVDVIPGS